MQTGSGKNKYTLSIFNPTGAEILTDDHPDSSGWCIKTNGLGHGFFFTELVMVQTR